MNETTSTRSSVTQAKALYGFLAGHLAHSGSRVVQPEAMTHIVHLVSKSMIRSVSSLVPNSSSTEPRGSFRSSLCSKPVGANDAALESRAGNLKAALNPVRQSFFEYV